MKIAICGDWHGDVLWTKNILTHLRDVEAVDRVIHVGDLSVLRRASKPKGCLMAKAIDSVGLPFEFIDGNHDHHDRLAKYKKPGNEWITDNIRYRPRGTVDEIDGVKFGFLGGAYSIGRKWRVLGESWWENEAPTREEAEPLMGANVDVLVTHDAPGVMRVRKDMKLPHWMEVESYETRKIINEVMFDNEPKHVFCGHWHQRTTQKFYDTWIHVLDKEWSGVGGNVALFDTETQRLVLSKTAKTTN